MFMQKLNPSARLKMNRDTFFIIYPEEGVYFRNNLKSLRMEGGAIDQWIERLIPIFDGTNTLEYLSNGLQESHKNRLYEIAQVLYENGFARDTSQNLPHNLPKFILNKYASQIEFLDNIGGSGGYRFQTYRQTKVLVIGSGSLLVSLVLSLIKSGLPSFSIMITDLQKTDQQRIKEIVSEARKSEPEIEITILESNKNSWRKILRPFDLILYGINETDFDQIRLLQTMCKEEMKTLLPVTILKEIAFVGPFVHSESEGCWESAYRRLHERNSGENNLSDSFSPTAGALLANMMVFELFKKTTGLLDIKKENPIYLLNLEKLEGSWHIFSPHPLVTGRAYAEPVKDVLSLLGKPKSIQGNIHSLFNKLTSKETGIFHLFEETDLIQLPLSQCKIQVIDPLSEGPARLYPEIVCSGLTHEGARREAGLVGIEAYMRGFMNSSILENHRLNKSESWGFGTGETTTEGLCRALQNWLDQEFIKQVNNKEINVLKLKLGQIEDEKCQYFLQTLNTMSTKLEIYLGSEVFGFPVIWVLSNGIWYGSPGLNQTTALQRSLQFAIMNLQNKESYRTSYGLALTSVNLQNNLPQNISIPSVEIQQSKIFLSALQLLKQHKRQVHIFNLNLEGIFREGVAGLYGLVVREEDLK
jgi:putative thiazole-containing bacteriocin maturation protein